MNIFKFNSLIPELSVTDILKTKHFMLMYWDLRFAMSVRKIILYL